MKNASTGAEAVLANTDFRMISGEPPNYAVTPQYVYGPFKNYSTLCTGTAVCMGRWSVADGSFSMVANPDPQAGRNGSGAAAVITSEDRFVTWFGRTTQTVISLYDSQANTFATIVPPSGNFLDTLGIDIAVVGGVPVVYYWTCIGGLAPLNCTLYRWSAANGSEVVDTTATVGNSFSDFNRFTPLVEADSDWVAYTRVVPGAGTNQQAQIVKRPTTGGAAITMANDSRDLILRDGVMLWWEMPASSASLMAWSAARGVTSLGAYPYGSLLGKAVGNGYAVYSLDVGSELMTWNGATGAITPKSAIKGSTLYATGGYVYFRYDSKVYRAPL